MSDAAIPVMRRLPVYLLLDCSGSMVGEPIEAMRSGLQAFASSLNNDPQAIETVWVSVISFSSVAEQRVPLTDVTQFETPELEPHGATALGDALDLLLQCIEAEVRKTSHEQKGDWRPMAFVFTDGEPTDAWQGPARQLRDADVVTLIVCGAGPEVKDETLKQLSDHVVHLRDTHPGTLISFMQWVTLAVTNTSRSLGARPQAEECLPDLPTGTGISLTP